MERIVMEQYIPKSILIAEIEKETKTLRQEIPSCENKEHQKGKLFGLQRALYLIDTLEVKEVDLEKEFKEFLDNVEGVPSLWHSDEQIEWAKDIAKHFFELGLKVQKGE